MTDLTIRDLIKAYRTDAVSPYRNLRFQTRKNYDSVLGRLGTDHGDVVLKDIRRRSLLEWHTAWANERGVPMAHALMTLLRIVVNFGVGFLEDDECARLSSVLRTMKFANCKPREVHLTAEMADAIRAEAHAQGCPSIALAQAIQFEGTFRQKDILGEWVPVKEPGISDVHSLGAGKWLRGIRWEKVDQHLVLHHVTSKRGKPVRVDLTLAPMVMEELRAAYCAFGEELTRARLPASGPIIIQETTGQPWIAHQFRLRWRQFARARGIPDAVQNRDSRAGAITEMIEHGVSIEDARKAATHATTQMTAKYSRGDEEATRRAMRARAAGRAAKNERKDAVA